MDKDKTGKLEKRGMKIIGIRTAIHHCQSSVRSAGISALLYPASWVDFMFSLQFIPWKCKLLRHYSKQHKTLVVKTVDLFWLQNNKRWLYPSVPRLISMSITSLVSLHFQFLASFCKLFLSELLVNDDESKVYTSQSVKLISVRCKLKNTFTISNAEIKGQCRKIEESVVTV